MQQFKYKGRDEQGQTVEGTIEGQTLLQVAQKLKRAQVIPIRIVPVSQSITVESILARYFGYGLPRLEDLIVFTQQFHTLIRSGVPILRTLKVIGETTKQPTLRSVILDLIMSLESGMTLSAAMMKHPQVFSSIYVGMVEVGETTGDFAQALLVLREYLENELDTRRRIRSALRYPLLVMAFIVVAVVIINVFVIPTFYDFFKSYQSVLPLPTRILMSCSEFIMQYGVLLLVLLLVMLGFVIAYFRTPVGRVNRDLLLLKLPIFGSLIQRSIYARFCRSLAMVQSAHIPLAQAFYIVAHAIDNLYVEHQIIRMLGAIQNGDTITRAARKSKLFSPIVLQMMSVGEETGHMSTVLLECAQYYEKDVDYDLKRISGLIEPILITVIAGLVLVLALGVFLPMWDISSITFKQMGGS